MKLMNYGLVEVFFPLQNTNICETASLNRKISIETREKFVLLCADCIARPATMFRAALSSARTFIYTKYGLWRVEVVPINTQVIAMN